MNIKPCPHRIPQPGDKVILLDDAYDILPGKEAAKLAKLPYCTVESALALPIGAFGDYEYTYEIYINESGYLIGLYNSGWKFLND